MRRKLTGVTQSQASWMNGGSWGSSTFHCSASTLKGKELCHSLSPPWISLSPLLYPLQGLGQCQEKGLGPRVPVDSQLAPHFLPQGLPGQSLARESGGRRLVLVTALRQVWLWMSESHDL